MMSFSPEDPIQQISRTRRNGPLRGLTFSSCGGLWPSAQAFLALRTKKDLIMLFWPIFGNFWCPVVTLVTFSSNFGNFERNPEKNKKIQRKLKKIKKNSKKFKNPNNIQKIQNIQKQNKKYQKNSQKSHNP